VPPPAAGRRDAEQPRPAASPARGRFAVAGGPAAPTGTLDDEADLGFGLTGSADVRPAGFPVALRAEASYHRFGADEDSFSNVRSGSVSMLGGQLNALAALGDAGTGGPAAGRYRLYALGGLGLYRAAASARLVDGSKDDESEFVLGFGFGGGVEFRAGTRRMFAEVRYQSIRTDNTSFAGDASNFIPIVLGVRF
jgi:opacity protein-like surface antigen